MPVRSGQALRCRCGRPDLYLDEIFPAPRVDGSGICEIKAKRCARVNSVCSHGAILVVLALQWRTFSVVQHPVLPWLNKQKMRKRNVVRGILSAIIFHYLALIGLIALLLLLRPLVWAAIYGVPYQSPTGAMDPNSGEWLISQIIFFLSWIPGGYAACHWDRENSNRSVLFVGLIFMLLGIVGGSSVSMDVVRKLVFYLENPIAVAIGWYIHRYLEQSEPV